MPLHRVSSLEEAALLPYRNVRDRDLLREQDVFLAEGEVVLRALIAKSRYRIRSVLLAESRVEKLRDILDRRPEIDVWIAPQEALNQLAGMDFHRGVLAAVERRVDTVESILADTPSIVLGLSGIANHDNVGGLFRNAAAFGVGAVLLDHATCDPLYRKAIRVSVGGVFRCPFARVASEDAMVEVLLARGYDVVALSPSGASELSAYPFRRPTALLLGAEGPGLSPATLARTTTLRLTMDGGFDSLNVATTSGIALYRLREALK